MAETRSLHRKLAQVMYEAERIPKNGTAPQVMGGYKFVQVGDAADFIRKALSEKNVTMMPTNVQVTGLVDRPTAKGGVMTTVDLIVTWTITDAESGESIEIQSFGAGADGGDKYSGKASTSAMKYALLSGFLLSTGEDTETTDTSQVRHGPVPAPVQPPAESADRADSDGETEEMTGRVSRRGIIRKGGPDEYKLIARQGPDGHQFGFRLEIDGADKAIPQCVVSGPIGEALFVFTGGKPETLVGKVANVAGILYHVTLRKEGKRANSWYRLHVDRFENDDVLLPAPVEDERVNLAAGHEHVDEPALPEPPPDIALVGEQEAHTAPLFDDVA